MIADSSTALMSTPILLDLLNGYRVSQLIFVAATLNIADMLKDGPKQYAELAEASGVDPASLVRCLNALAAAHVFTRLDDGRFELNVVSEQLRGDVPSSLKALVVFSGQQAYPTWGGLLDAIRSGRTAFEQMHGMTQWDYQNLNPSAGRLFDQAMSTRISDAAKAVVGAYDFSRFRCVVDVAGGQGVLLASSLRANPSVQGILFDQDQVVQNAAGVLETDGVLERCKLIGGSFFELVPPGGDAYLLSRILHDWEDDQAVEILKACRRAMQTDHTLLLVERVLDPVQPELGDALMDIHMMVMNGGRERAESEFEMLLARAGFDLVQVIPTQSPVAIIESKAT